MEQFDWRMELWELSAREQIRYTIARYNQVGDSGKIYELTDQFHPDGELHIAGEEPLIGRKAIAERLKGTLPKPDRAFHKLGKVYVRHHVSTLVIDSVTTERATASSYFFVVRNTGIDHWGRYRDVFVPWGSRWLLSRRSVTVDDFGRGALNPSPDPTATDPNVTDPNVTDPNVTDHSASNPAESN